MAGVLFWLTSRGDVMGDYVNGWFTKAFAGLGLILLLAMAANTALVQLPAKIEQYRQKRAEAAVVLPVKNQGGDVAP